MKIYWNGHSKNIIGNRLKELRTAQGISQKTLAARLQTEGFEFTDLTILRIEHENRFGPHYQIEAIQNFFHKSTHNILGATDKKNAALSFRIDSSRLFSFYCIIEFIADSPHCQNINWF